MIWHIALAIAFFVLFILDTRKAIQEYRHSLACEQGSRHRRTHRIKSILDGVAAAAALVISASYFGLVVAP